MSNAVKGSNNRKKKRLALAKEWQRVKERERGKLHEETAALVMQSNTFYVENLSVLNLVENHRLARSILEADWETFLEMLTYKAENAGGKVEKVDPKDTSQLCSCCGSKPLRKLTLSVRKFQCEFRGFETDRDVNAELSILQRGLGMFLKPGGNTPVRRENENDGVALAAPTV